jgi:hypothetical protein
MATISPGDAEVALRTFPRRWRALLEHLDPDDPDTMARLAQPGPDGRTAIESAAAAAATLETATANLRVALTSDRPAIERPEAPIGSSLADSLQRIDAAAPALADAVRDVGSSELDRGASLDGREVTVRELIAAPVDEVAGYLRSAGDALRSGR